jgi:hypothetical protein
VPHHLLLDRDGRANGIQPGTVRVTHCVRTDHADPGLGSGFLEYVQHPGVRKRETPKFNRTGENPIVSAGELCSLLPRDLSTSSSSGAMFIAVSEFSVLTSSTT